MFLILQTGFAQVGIGTTNPDPNVMLDVNGKVKVTDGNQGENKVLVSDATGTATWSNETDGVKTRVIRQLNFGANSEVVLWTHPAGIEVRFDAETETVTVENISGDDTHYWDVAIYGGATGRNSIEATNYKTNYFRDDGTHDLLYFDLGGYNIGWFNIIAVDQNNELDGFNMSIIYYDDNINGMVQFWDN